ncbi:acetyltransferase [Paenibacillus swuensis]|uniref:Acetyltransferase n=1 Tax=Paenibacillus swuensis TaxID=1178515 RepID=A0A172TM77_9BACL|nr:GNAT family N-acetyltransferase [Paenibacillus swuensis]ANE48138.1 acetyltransferase [Paenibacillus swuensis]
MTASDFTIIRPQKEDLQAIAILFNAYRMFYGQETNLELAETFIRERYDLQESVIFAAKDSNGTLLGFTQLYPSFSSVSAKRLWILNDLYIAEDSRSRGVGRALMEESRLYAIETGSKGITLQTAKDNFLAQHLYESLGYKKETDFYEYFLKL